MVGDRDEISHVGVHHWFRPSRKKSEADAMAYWRILRDIAGGVA